MQRVLVAGLTAVLALSAQQYTRGVGVYPGNPSEDFSPSIQNDEAYRNLAFRRAAYHSSSYDYNLTGQLVTDGLKETAEPRRLTVSTSEHGVLDKNEREFMVDGNVTSTINLSGPRVWVQFGMLGGSQVPEVNRVQLVVRPTASQDGPEGWTLTVSGSDDGQSWRELGKTTGSDRPGAPPPGAARGRGGFGFGRMTPFSPEVIFAAPARSRYYRVAFDAPSVTQWRFSEVSFFHGAEQVQPGGPHNFNSAWMSAGSGEEWVYVDLGANCQFDRVALSWIARPAEGSVEVSDDAKSWKTVQALGAPNGLIDDIRTGTMVRRRYVRVSMKRSGPAGSYALSEMEVYGHGGPVARPHAAPTAIPNGTLNLAGGEWRLERAPQVSAGGEVLSRPEFADDTWVVATVPATVLGSYLNVGAVPDPDFSDNQYLISDSYFYADFWYRREFDAPRAAAGRRVWLNFDGINWKADVFLNGAKIGRIEGGFMRGLFDVTDRIRPGARNAIAIKIEKNATPGSIKERTIRYTGLNGGALGLDNPTYHASVGWDWIPPIRGRNIGVWGDVYLTQSGAVTIADPLVTTALPVPDVSRADVAISATLQNHEARPVSGTLHGRFGEIAFEMGVTLEANASKVVKLDPTTTPALRISNPKLWWPAGYGAQDMYPVELRFETGARAVSDVKAFQVGVRQFTFSEADNTLRIWVNGRRFIARGGNWGFPESMLRYRAREYDIAVRYHKDMNFTMIRNWVGQTPDDAFFAACDRHGIVVWQDFWLANPVDGLHPADNDLFMGNAADFVKKIRNHPSVGIYVGRNEGDPPEPLNSGLKAMTEELHPGLYYIANSAMRGVSGGGWYAAQPLKVYYTQRPKTKLHSEMGMPNVPPMESIRRMMKESEIWPQGRVWGVHDFTTEGAQRGTTFQEMIAKGYGGADNAEDWVKLAQFINYDGYRAMFESQSTYRMGLLLWMSHSAWPSFVWQTYDYYFEPTGGYFGSKKGSEPLHIQWNPAADTVEVVNYNGGDAPGLTAKVEVLNLDGSRQWEKTVQVNSKEDSTETLFKMEYPAGLTPTNFIRLVLSRGNTVVSTNFYLHSQEMLTSDAPAAQGGRGPQGPQELIGNFQAIRTLPKVKLEASTEAHRDGERWVLTTEVRNPTKTPALMVRVKAVQEKSGESILPALYSDNYIPLMPGERAVVKTELENADTRGELPRIVVEGFNVE